MIHDQTKKYIWDATETARPDKSVDWYWGLGILAVTGIILCIIAKNYLFAILITLGGFMLAYSANDKPSMVTVEISDRGVKINKDLYTYETIRSFWMYTDTKNKNQLLLVTGRAWMPKHIIALPDSISAKDIRVYLLDHIEEKETKPSVVDTLIDAFGF